MPIACARCQMPLPAWEFASAPAAACTSCGARNSAAVFPALFREAAAAVRPETVMDGEATCFDHPAKRAVAACNQCGKFVCPLCAVEFAEQVWCPGCVAGGSGQARVAQPDASRVLYDSIAFTGLLITFFVFWPVTILTAPAAVVLAIVKWKQPLSLVRHSRWRFVLAILLGLLITGGWLLLAVYGVVQWQSGKMR
jgi:hypothetical protein